MYYLFILLLVTSLIFPSYSNNTDDWDDYIPSTVNTMIKQIYQLDTIYKTIDPFIFCVHHYDIYPADISGTMKIEKGKLKNRNMGNDFIIKDNFRMYHGLEYPGFPAHPHRGFETITITRNGIVDHFDSLDNTARYGNGDIQWLTTGSGVQHSEMFPLINKDKLNINELYQIWINLPKKSKMVPGYFKMLWSEDVKTISLNNALITVIAGNYNGISSPSPPPDSWASDPKSDVCILTIIMNKNSKVILPSSGANRMLYVRDGSIKIENQTIKSSFGVELLKNLEIIIESDYSDLLLLQANPINEPVAQYGPFVMNTQDEIRQAYDDYSRTQFGGWKWGKNDPIHSREKGRFASRFDRATGKNIEELPPIREIKDL